MSAVTGHRWALLEKSAFVLTVMGALAATLHREHFPSWDGAAHIGGASAFIEYSPAMQEVFQRDWFPSPNLVSHLIAGLLVQVVRPTLADRVLAGIAIVVVCAGARFATTHRGRWGGLAAYPAVALSVGWFVHGGQYSFLMGVGLLLFLVGVVLRADRLRDRRGAVCALLAATYLAHAIPFALALVFVAWRVAVQPRGWDRREAWRELRAVLPAVVPLVALAGWFALTRSAGVGAERWGWGALGVNTLHLGAVMTVFDDRERVLGLLIAVPVYLAVGAGVLAAGGVVPSGRTERRWRPEATLLVGFGGTVALCYVALPDSVAGGGFLSGRLLLVAMLTGLVAAASLPVPRALLGVLGACGVVAVVASVALRSDAHAGFDRDIAEYLSVAPYLDAGDTLLAVRVCDESRAGCASEVSMSTRPLSEAGGYLMAERGVVELSFYEGLYDYFPLQFRDAVDPGRHMSEEGGEAYLIGEPPAVLLAHYEDTTGVRVDQVLVWGHAQATPEARSSEAMRRFEADLSERFVLEYRSVEGRVELYRHR